MRRLMLLRHAKSDWPTGVGDQDRPLGPRGRHDAPRMGEEMARRGLRPDLAIISTARRTLETFALVSPFVAAHGGALREGGLRGPGRRPSSTSCAASTTRIDGPVWWSATIRRMEQAASFLIGEGSHRLRDKLGEKFPTAALAVIDFAAGGWRDDRRGERPARAFPDARRHRVGAPHDGRLDHPRRRGAHRRPEPRGLCRRQSRADPAPRRHRAVARRQDGVHHRAGPGAGRGWPAAGLPRQGRRPDCRRRLVAAAGRHRAALRLRGASRRSRGSRAPMAGFDAPDLRAAHRHRVPVAAALHLGAVAADARHRRLSRRVAARSAAARQELRRLVGRDARGQPRGLAPAPWPRPGIATLRALEPVRPRGRSDGRGSRPSSSPPICGPGATSASPCRPCRPAAS